MVSLSTVVELRQIHYLYGAQPIYKSLLALIRGLRANNTFDDYVFIAPNCRFTTAEHAIDPEMRKNGIEISKPITIGNNVWIGSGFVILAGVTIGDNSVIGAGSVVNKDIPSGVVAVGVPCKVLREISEEDKHRYPMYD